MEDRRPNPSPPLGALTSTWRPEASLFTSWLMFWAAGAGLWGLCRSSRVSSLGRVLSSQFLALCRQQPSLVVELAKELLDFVGSASSPRTAGLMRTSVVWAIGEYLAVSWDLP
ncbi:hypothetical protein MC885_001702 [Smutsia gigantea]|nr:hypothetical protein MC885_001702 [Smutsia gigantea]